MSVVSPTTGNSKQTNVERIHMFEEALLPPKLAMANIRALASQGIPDAPGLRATYWKIMLYYLPLDKSLWEKELQKSRDTYNAWLQELIIDPGKESLKQKESAVSDHPLSQASDSQWNTFFKDHDLMDEIDKDVKRTLPHLHFFNPEANVINHHEVLKRVLFIYAKLNPGIRYVQGMNEVLGPMYYIFALHPEPQWRDNAEADSFFCFTNLMSEIRDNFCKTLDKSDSGIVGNIRKLNMLLKDKDPELWADLEDKKLNPQFYTFRWLTLLLSQEFDLPDVLRLWDSLFADPNRFEFFYYFCCAMIVQVREQLLDGSFADNLKLLQSYPPVDFHDIYNIAEKLHERRWFPPPVRRKEPSPEEQHKHVGKVASLPGPNEAKKAFSNLLGRANKILEL